MSTEADIVERLRWPGISGPDDHPISAALRVEAADLITKLRAERDAAIVALKPFATAFDELSTEPGGYPWQDFQHVIRDIKFGDLRQAAALIATDREGQK